MYKNMKLQRRKRFQSPSIKEKKEKQSQHATAEEIPPAEAAAVCQDG